MKQNTRTNQFLSLAALLVLLLPMGLHAQYNGGVGKGDAIALFRGTANGPQIATQMVFSNNPPSSVGTNLAFQVAVELRDASGNIAAFSNISNASVSMAIANNPGAASLIGSNPVNAVDGFANFSLSLDAPSTGYTLQATAGALSATSSAFDVLSSGILYQGGIGKGDARGSYMNYTYNGSWSPENPNGFTTGEKTVNTMYVESGSATLSSAINAKRVEISPGAALEAASLTLTDSVLILADATGYGMYKGNQQNVRIQQHVANAGWHNMALPVSGNLNQFGSVNTAVHPNTRNVYSWDESTGNWVDIVGASDGSQMASSAGAGYMVYVGTNGVSAAASALDAKGSMLTTATPTLSNAGTTNDANRDGWNLIGNPFSCGLDFTQLTLTDVNNSFSIWDPASEVYRDYSGLVEDIASGVIAPMQSFWVKATGASPSVGTLDMDGDGTVSTSATFYKQQTVVADRFAIEVVDLSNTSVHDEIVIGMVAGTHDGLDQYWDAPSRLNAANVPTLMVVHQGEEMSINAIDYSPHQLQPKQLQLRLVSQKHGQAFEIRLHDSLLTHAYHIELEDTKLQRKQKLTDGHYRFTLDTAATAAYRFVLHLSPITTVATPLAPVYDDWSLSQDGNTLQISEVEQLEGATEGWIYDMNARLVAHFSWETNNANKQVDISSLPTGLYLLRLSTIRGEEVQKLLVP